jgi:hypothetical protein
MELILENVRCFSGKHVIPIRPLTFLVGENSTGKTTVLAMLSAIANWLPFFPSPDFNAPPFDVGSFDNIATYRGGKAGRSPSFAVGMNSDRKGESPLGFRAHFREKAGQPDLEALAFDTPDLHLTVQLAESVARAEISVEDGERIGSVEVSLRSSGSRPRNLLDEIERELTKEMGPARIPDLTGLLENCTSLLTWANFITFAPVRTKPKRIYDQLRPADFDPGGDHVPYVLSTVLEGASGKKNGDSLLEATKDFGKESGLFKDVRVTKLGRKPGDPFRVMITTAGPACNLADVGYGVSQSLPLVIDSIRAPRGATILVQQPEVHLHPKAQAALGTFLTHLVVADKKTLVVETHSDYIVDRVRQEVAKGTISPDKVGILYFEKRGVDAQVHPIDLDETGNVTNPPEGYRDFFLKEEMELLMRGSHQ